MQLPLNKSEPIKIFNYKLLFAAILYIFILFNGAFAFSHPVETISHRPPPCYNCHPIIVNNKSNDTATYVFAAAVIGLITGIILSQPPRDYTHIRVQF
jgi:hypothetical protein